MDQSETVPSNITLIAVNGGSIEVNTDTLADILFAKFNYDGNPIITNTIRSLQPIDIGNGIVQDS